MNALYTLVAVVALFASTCQAVDCDPNFLVPHHDIVKIHCHPSLPSDKVKSDIFVYCGMTIDQHFVLARLVDSAEQSNKVHRCHGVRLRESMRSGAQMTADLSSLEKDDDRTFAVLCRRGFGVLPKELFMSKRVEKPSTDKAKDLEPLGLHRVNDAKEKELYQAIFGNTRATNNEEQEYLENIFRVTETTKVQGIPLETYFKNLVTPNDGSHVVAVVGGAVRDSVTKAPIKDVDVAVSLPYNDFLKKLEETWQGTHKGSSALEIEDVLRLEGTRKRFGMALLDRDMSIEAEKEGLDIGQLKVKRPLPFYYRKKTKGLSWTAKTKSSAILDVQDVAKGTLEHAKMEFKAVGDFRDVRHKDVAAKIIVSKKKSGSKPSVTSSSASTETDTTADDGKPEHWEYPLTACLAFTRNMMPEAIVTHLALAYDRDFHLYRCFMSSHGKFENYNEKAVPKESTEPPNLEVFEILDWGIGVKNGIFPPPQIEEDDGDDDKQKKKKKKLADRTTWVNDDTLTKDPAVNQYLYGYSFYQDAHLRDYRANAVYALFRGKDLKKRYFVDPLRKSDEDSGMNDLFPFKGGAGKIVIADKPAYEQDLGGQFRFFKMLRKNFAPREEDNLVRLTCHYLLLRLDEALSAADESRVRHFFKRMWKKLFDEQEDLRSNDDKTTVETRLADIYKEMSNKKNRAECEMTWNQVVSAAAQLLYPEGKASIHKLVTAIADSNTGKGIMKPITTLSENEVEETAAGAKFDQWLSKETERK